MKRFSLAEHPIGRLAEALSPCVLDLGARGGADEELLDIAWASRIFCFEADPVEANSLSQSGDARWREFKVLPFAVGGNSGRSVLYVPRSPQAASILPHNANMVDRFGHRDLHEVWKTIAVETVTLDQLRSDGHLGRVDYVKLDVEGAELAVLKAGRITLEDCVALKVECSFLPQRVGQPLTWEVAQFLTGEGFEIVELSDIHRWRRRNLPAHPYSIRFGMRYSRGQIAQCDLFLLRSIAGIQNPTQALRLILMSASMGYFDYAVTVLREYPELSDRVRKDFTFELESELREWSAITGRRELRSAIVRRVRGLVPLFRSWAGRLPFATPLIPY